MASEIRKVLGQAALAATTLTDVYAVPAATQAVVSSIAVCNKGAGAATFRVSIAVAAAADDPKQYIYYDMAIGGNVTIPVTIGIALGALDVVRVYGSSADFSVTVFGVEIA